MTDFSTLTPEQINHFWSRVDKGAGPDGCWPWTEHRNRHGYGGVRVNGRDQKAHRVAYGLAHGSIPPGDHHGTTCVLHTCDNPPCCNPAHLRAGSMTDNMADRNARGRQAIGSAHGSAKLSELDIPGIRAALARGETQGSIARRHGVSRSAINDIAVGHTWTHVSGGVA